MTPVELDAVRARYDTAVATNDDHWVEGYLKAEDAMASAHDVPALLALVAELTRERDEARMQRDYAVKRLVDCAVLPGAIPAAEARGRRWAIEALRDRALYDSMLPTAAPMGPWVQHLNVAAYLESLLAEPTTEETP